MLASNELWEFSLAFLTLCNGFKWDNQDFADIFRIHFGTLSEWRVLTCNWMSIEFHAFLWMTFSDFGIQKRGYTGCCQSSPAHRNRVEFKWIGTKTTDWNERSIWNRKWKWDQFQSQIGTNFYRIYVGILPNFLDFIWIGSKQLPWSLSSE